MRERQNHCSNKKLGVSRRAGKESQAHRGRGDVTSTIRSLSHFCVTLWMARAQATAPALPSAVLHATVAAAEALAAARALSLAAAAAALSLAIASCPSCPRSRALSLTMAASSAALPTLEV